MQSAPDRRNGHALAATFGGSAFGHPVMGHPGGFAAIHTMGLGGARFAFRDGHHFRPFVRNRFAFVSAGVPYGHGYYDDCYARVWTSWGWSGLATCSATLRSVTKSEDCSSTPSASTFRQFERGELIDEGPRHIEREFDLRQASLLRNIPGDLNYEH
jgi:hypothetical protein